MLAMCSLFGRHQGGGQGGCRRVRTPTELSSRLRQTLSQLSRLTHLEAIVILLFGKPSWHFRCDASDSAPVTEMLWSVHGCGTAEVIR